MSANDVTINLPDNVCAREGHLCCPTDSAVSTQPTEALRPQNERKSAHAAVARRAGGPRVSETR